MSGLSLLMFILALPALAVIGHDAYLFYINQPQDFMLSATGFLWTKYHPDSFLWVKSALDPEQWALLTTYVLEQKAVFVALAFALFFFVIFGTLQLALKGPFGSNEKKSRSKSSGTNRREDILSRGDKKRGRR